jgi:hypothetical protein
MHIERTATEALRTFIIIYPLLKSESLGIDTKLTLCKAMINSVMTYAFLSWEFTADSRLLKLHRLQNQVFRTTGNLTRRTPTPALHVAFRIPYIYDFVTKLCRQQAEIIQKPENVNNVLKFGQGEAQHRKRKRLTLGGGQA